MKGVLGSLATFSVVTGLPGCEGPDLSQDPPNRC